MDAVARRLRPLRLIACAAAVGHDADGHCRPRRRVRKDARDIPTEAATMMRKLLVGMALVAILCAVGASGYAFGKYLKERERIADVRGD